MFGEVIMAIGQRVYNNGVIGTIIQFVSDNLVVFESDDGDMTTANIRNLTPVGS